MKVPPDPPKSEEDVHAEAKSTEDMRKANSKQRNEQYRPPPPRPTEPVVRVSLDVDSLKLVRNLLMKHHEMKHLDESYQVSEMCSNTNTVIQQLNDMIGKKKKAAL